MKYWNFNEHVKKPPAHQILSFYPQKWQSYMALKNLLWRTDVIEALNLKL